MVLIRICVNIYNSLIIVHPNRTCYTVMDPHVAHTITIRIRWSQGWLNNLGAKRHGEKLRGINTFPARTETSKVSKSTKVFSDAGRTDKL